MTSADCLSATAKVRANIRPISPSDLLTHRFLQIANLVAFKASQIDLLKVRIGKFFSPLIKTVAILITSRNRAFVLELKCMPNI